MQQATALMANAAPRQPEPVPERKIQAGVEMATDTLSKLSEHLPNS